MDLEQQANLVNTIHDTLSNYVDQRLKVRANMGRSKIVESEGVAYAGSPPSVRDGG